MACSVCSAAVACSLWKQSHEDHDNIAQSLPDTLPANVANKKLVDDFKMSNMHMILMQKDMDAKEKRKMLEEIDEVEGVKWSLGMNTLFG